MFQSSRFSSSPQERGLRVSLCLQSGLCVSEVLPPAAQPGFAVNRQQGGREGWGRKLERIKLINVCP